MNDIICIALLQDKINIYMNIQSDGEFHSVNTVVKQVLMYKQGKIKKILVLYLILVLYIRNHN